MAYMGYTFSLRNDDHEKRIENQAQPFFLLVSHYRWVGFLEGGGGCGVEWRGISNPRGYNRGCNSPSRLIPPPRVIPSTYNRTRFSRKGPSDQRKLYSRDLGITRELSQYPEKFDYCIILGERKWTKKFIFPECLVVFERRERNDF